LTSTFFTADPHFGHRAMAATGKGWRPFATVEEHDETLIENWNKVVRAEDHVWLLGDCGMGPEDTILDKVARLTGHKHLVAGNHDKVWSGNRDGYQHQARWMQVFESVQDFARRRIDSNQNFMLSHFPYKGAGDHTAEERYNQYRLANHGLWLAHGHVHDAWKVRGRMVNVGVDVWDWTPVHLDALVAEFRAERSELAG
jgi:calcineurin-like phosphoesterase family protein